MFPWCAELPGHGRFYTGHAACSCGASHHDDIYPAATQLRQPRRHTRTSTYSPDNYYSNNSETIKTVTVMINNISNVLNNSNFKLYS
eukprot:225546-Amphidinium_carterae.1